MSEAATTPTQPSRAAAFGASLQQYTFSAPSPPRRVTRASTSAASTPSRQLASPLPSTNSTASIATSTPPTTSSPSHAPKKRKRESSSYASPSKYAHIPNLLTDSISPNLVCLFIGVNPGIRTATTGHAYSHPSNLFWKLLHSSGCTTRLCKPSEDAQMPELYALGLTNIVPRATKDASELSKQEMDDGVEVLEEKCRRWRPESVCVVGKGIWESLWRVRHGRGIRKEEFRYGWQDAEERMGVIEGMDGEVGGGWEGARVFVATSTSGLAAGMRPHEKEEVWRELGEWVERRRRERKGPDWGGVKSEVEGIVTVEGDEENVELP